jgi:hypothetical protein
MSTTKMWTDEISFGDDGVALAAFAESADPTIETAPVAPPTLTIVPPPTVRQAMPVISQDVERICAEGVIRATADAKAAAALGFPVRPTVYALGTVVNSIGVDNFRESRCEVEALPRLPELARTFTDRIASELRVDRLVDARQSMMTTDGKLCADGMTFAITERALDGLASHVTPGGAGYLKACPTELRALNLNHWLASSDVRDARASRTAGADVMRAKQITLRTRTTDATPTVYAVTGPRYVPFNVDRVVREAAAGIGGDARGKLTYDGYRMTLDAMFHSNIAPQNAVAGEFFKGTVRVKAADDGTGSVSVKLGLWRNLCRNLIIVDFDTVLVGSRRHVGAANIEEDIRGLMASANERIALVVGKWSEASTEDVLARYDLQDVDQVFRGLVLNGCVTATGVKPDEMVKRLHTAWEREPGYSKTSILNAITRSAHESSWSSWADQEELESAAGSLLYQPVWNLDYSERTPEQLLA